MSVYVVVLELRISSYCLRHRRILSSLTRSWVLGLAFTKISLARGILARRRSNPFTRSWGRRGWAAGWRCSVAAVWATLHPHHYRPPAHPPGCSYVGCCGASGTTASPPRRRSVGCPPLASRPRPSRRPPAPPGGWVSARRTESPPACGHWHWHWRPLTRPWRRRQGRRGRRGPRLGCSLATLPHASWVTNETEVSPAPTTNNTHQQHTHVITRVIQRRFVAHVEWSSSAYLPQPRPQCGRLLRGREETRFHGHRHVGVVAPDVDGGRTRLHRVPQLPKKHETQTDKKGMERVTCVSFLKHHMRTSLSHSLTLTLTLSLSLCNGEEKMRSRTYLSNFGTTGAA